MAKLPWFGRILVYIMLLCALYTLTYSNFVIRRI
jgi:hypothetical protein